MCGVKTESGFLIHEHLAYSQYMISCVTVAGRYIGNLLSFEEKITVDRKILKFHERSIKIDDGTHATNSSSLLSSLRPLKTRPVSNSTTDLSTDHIIRHKSRNMLPHKALISTIHSVLRADRSRARYISRRFVDLGGFLESCCSSTFFVAESLDEFCDAEAVAC